MLTVHSKTIKSSKPLGLLLVQIVFIFRCTTMELTIRGLLILKSFKNIYEQSLIRDFTPVLDNLAVQIITVC